MATTPTCLNRNVDLAYSIAVRRVPSFCARRWAQALTLLRDVGLLAGSASRAGSRGLSTMDNAVYTSLLHARPSGRGVPHGGHTGPNPGTMHEVGGARHLHLHVSLIA